MLGRKNAEIVIEADDSELKEYDGEKDTKSGRKQN
jgi:hypothetical protein